MRKISILGSTGSIGTSALRVVEERPKDFKIIGLSAYRNVTLLARQIKKFRPKIISVKDEQVIASLRKLVNLKGIEVHTQDRGLLRIATHKDVEILLVATTGIVSLVPTLSALKKGKTIALANKEPLVMAGHIVMEAARKSKGCIIPVDSEHSAIFQCLSGTKKEMLSRIFLTGSGGPFKNYSFKQLENVTVKQALKHPKWKMGKKISIDSATLMNKGLELIEARWLFDVEPSKIEIIVHPEAIIHSMVEFCDRSVIAQLGITDMRLPIAYALDYPKRKPSTLSAVDFIKMGNMTFAQPDEKKFPALRTARRVAAIGGSAGCVMNAANEVAVAAFLDKKIKFLEITKIIDKILNKHKFVKNPSLDTIFQIDEGTRREAQKLCYL